MANYYDDWEQATYTCKVCGWQGLGSECRSGEYYREFYEICCPSCGKDVDFVMFPTIEESRQNWDEVSEADKVIVEYTEQRQREFADRSLQSPEQLPEIEGDDLIFVWDIEDYSHGGDTLIKYGERIIWSEPAFYEGFKRFEEVALILKRKYGKRMQDLVPTGNSSYFLYGDAVYSVDRIEKFREKLKYCE